MVLQSRRCSLEVVAGTYTRTSATSSNNANEVISIKVEDGTDIIIKPEEISVVKFEDTDRDIKEEKFCVDESFSTIKAEQDQVSHLYLCPLLDAVHQYLVMPAVFCHCHLCLSAIQKQFHCSEWTFVSVYGLCETSREVCAQVNAEKSKYLFMYFYQNVGHNPYLNLTSDTFMIQKCRGT
jgi:hypothetical protein